MSNLPLKPLKWEDREDSAMVTTMFRGYWVTSDTESKDKFCVYYGSSTGEPARGFATIEDAKHWAEHEHYASEMQPYVAPILTWINYKVQKPIAKGSYLIRDHQGRVAIGEYDQGFYMASGSEKWGVVAHWMPIPEFKQGE